MFIVISTIMIAQTDKRHLLPPDFTSRSQNTDLEDADYSWELQTLEGKSLKLSQFKNKVIFINLWATWCTGCIGELPNIQRLYESLKDEDIVFLIVSDQAAEPVRNFLANKEYTFPVYLQKPWWLERLPYIEFAVTGGPKVFRTLGIPTTIIVDRKGQIVFKRMGAAKWDDESCEKFLRGLL